MTRRLLVILAGAAVWAQNSSPPSPEPPPEVDKALRARINEFCQLHKEGRFRQAEAMVAEDTKDYFYEAGKPRYVSWEIKSITYNKDFTTAKATVICELYLPATGFQGHTVKLLTPFNWKIENGQWMWYMDKDVLMMSPFGKMTAPPPNSDAGDHPRLAPPVIPTTADQFFNRITLDKTAVSLKPGASDQVTISNGTTGLVAFEITKQVPGVEAKLQSTMVPAAGKDLLTLRAGPGAMTGVLEVRVKPIGPLISIRISIE